MNGAIQGGGNPFRIGQSVSMGHIETSIGYDVPIVGRVIQSGLTQAEARYVAEKEGPRFRDAARTSAGNSVGIHLAIVKETDGTYSVVRPESPTEFKERAKAFVTNPQHGQAVLDGLYVEVYTSQHAIPATGIEFAD
jgi:hypothetical protein